MNDREKPGCLGQILQALGLAPKAAEPDALPYRIRDDFLSQAERNFYHALRAAAGDRAIICPKVSLADLFYAASGDHKKNTGYLNRIARKHVDFVLCDPQSLGPLLGIELDDSSHGRAGRQDRDRFVDQVFAAAELPLLRQPVRPTYNIRELTAAIEALSSTARDPATQVGCGSTDESVEATLSSSPKPTGAEVPLCPKCGQPMVLRTAQKEGPHQGSQFWGCVNYPRCRGIREMVTGDRR